MKQIEINRIGVSHILMTDVSKTQTGLRNEYPRPQFQRKEWLSLNGEWEFGFDDLGIGEDERWYLGDVHGPLTRKIVVPFTFQSKLSGIDDPSFHDVVWYRRTFEIRKNGMDSGSCCISGPWTIWQKYG